MDASTLDALLAELGPRLMGSRLGRARPAGAHAVTLEVMGDRESRLWFEAARDRAGLYLLRRGAAGTLADERAATGATRHATLLFRKHLEGRRISELRRVVGERTVLLVAGDATVALRLSGVPALTLVVEGAPVATVGEGREAWPLPQPAPDRERLWATSAARGPTLVAPAPIEGCHDAELAAASAVTLGTVPLAGSAGVELHPVTWLDAAALFLLARVRGSRFEGRRKTILAAIRRELRRLTRLEAHLRQDLSGLPDVASLRRHGEALLASPVAVPAGASEAVVPDPYDSQTLLHVPLDARLSAVANADRFFEKARRIERSRRRIEAHLVETRRALEAESGRDARAREARDLSDLEPVPPPDDPGAEDPAPGPRRYLTSRGLSLLVGRGARENHRLTFAEAGPEDLWLHARDVPGAHVILRDNEGRAGAEDLREAAEVAAFFSDARRAAKVDVHVTRRKHVHPARGGPGRVKVSHSDTLRVAPRDPSGHLRRR